MCNGILSGLVSVTAGCSVISPHGAIVIGTIGGGIFSLISHVMLHQFRVDDTVDAFSVHGACGAWSLIAAALFATDEFSPRPGAFYGGSQLLGTAAIGILAITAWSAGLATVLFASLRWANVLRIPAEEEIVGQDRGRLGGSAYGADAMQLPVYQVPPPYVQAPSYATAAAPPYIAARELNELPARLAPAEARVEEAELRALRTRRPAADADIAVLDRQAEPEPEPARAATPG